MRSHFFCEQPLSVAELLPRFERRGEGMNSGLKIASRILVAVILCAAVASRAVADHNNNGAIVTESGPLKGITAGPLNEYLGIPYAAAPLGALRWLPPKSFGKWHGVFQATQFGNECSQLPSLFGRPPFSENCLFLNVYMPKQKKHRGEDESDDGLPVMVWIHGGALVVGGGDVFDPTPLVEQGVIVVTINYRLGLLGFFAQPALDAEGHLNANYGLMDQQFALKWVRRNIKAFGGDPGRVTIFGESAGGLSVYSNLASSMAAGLFQRAISESGSYASFTDYQPWIIPIADAETTGSLLVPSGTSFASSVGCSSQTAACLRAVSASTLIGVVPGGLYPIVDGTLLTQTPGTAFVSGQFNRVPVISGTNHDEWRLFVALDYDLLGTPLTNAGYTAAVDALWGPLGPSVLLSYPLPTSPPADAASIALGASGTDGVFSCPARHADQSLSRYVTTYTYEFNDENAPSSLAVSFPLGAYHGAEIQYLFIYFGVPAPFSSDQQQLSDAMISYWTEFAETGNPNSNDEPLWSPYSPVTDEFQSFMPPTPAVESTFAVDHLCTTLWDFL
jgi:para-nitrobenzyl esterase